MQTKPGEQEEPRDQNKPAETGNASNPSPTDLPPEDSNQLLDNKAEKYLREVASIEDLPDAEDQQDMDETLKKENEG